MAKKFGLHLKIFTYIYIHTCMNVCMSKKERDKKEKAVEHFQVTRLMSIELQAFTLDGQASMAVKIV